MIKLNRHACLDQYNFHRYYLDFEVEQMVDEFFDVLEWYRKEAQAISKNYNVDDDALMASITVLFLDCGCRAENIIKKYKEDNEQSSISE